MDIRGVPESVQEMRFSAQAKENSKWEITGDEETLGELLSLISEELCYDLCPKKSVSPLLRICKKVDPASLDWIGM